MNAAKTSGWLIVLLMAAGIVGICAAQMTAHAATSPVASGAERSTLGHSSTDGVTNPADDTRKAQIKAIDEKIQSIREQFKSQADPLQAQLKTLRDKLDADLKPLEEQRKALVEQGESPEMITLNQDEASQLASLTEREKAEIEKLKQSYEDQKKEIQQDFQKRRQALGKK